MINIFIVVTIIYNCIDIVIEMLIYSFLDIKSKICKVFKYIFKKL